MRAGVKDGVPTSTPVVLLECVDYHSMRRDGSDPEAVLRELVKSTASCYPVMLWLFEPQESAAVLLPDADHAALLL